MSKSRKVQCFTVGIERCSPQMTLGDIFLQNELVIIPNNYDLMTVRIEGMTYMVPDFFSFDTRVSEFNGRGEIMITFTYANGRPDYNHLVAAYRTWREQHDRTVVPQKAPAKSSWKTLFGNLIV